jgi:two-component sensor histidine kinase
MTFQLVSLITFTFGALTFSVLTLFYWRERRRRSQSSGGLVFPAFTLACAAAFAINLSLRVASALNAESFWVTGLTLALEMVTGLLPPLLFHLIYREEEPHLQSVIVWRWLLYGFYALSAAAGLAQGLEDAELVATGWGDWLDRVPALMLAAAGALGMAAQALSRRRLNVVERRHRRWNWVLLAAMLLCVAANFAVPSPLVGILPDYLVLGFFCVTLYYKERLVFFDLLIKRGAFFALGLVGLSVFFPWTTALLLTPFWLMGPWIFEQLTRVIDRVWLRRRYSSSDAERGFIRDIQISLTEKDLEACASRSLEDIFQAPAEVCFAPAPAPADTGDGLYAELEQQGACVGSVRLGPRANYIPYMSDDRRLLQSVARTLGVVLENVRFREQQEHLRRLASRAELKALRAQINPHFLFNALNAIAGLIQDQPQLADETVEQLAHVFRYTLRRSEKEWVRLDEEIEFITAYLRIEQARFGPRLHVKLDVDPAASGISVPAMSIQPLIENAIKHGVSAIAGPGRVSLRAAMKGETLMVEVIDNGPGFASEPAPEGHGLCNVMERLRGYYGDHARLHWENGQEGTRVVLEIHDTNSDRRR